MQPQRKIRERKKNYSVVVHDVFHVVPKFTDAIVILQFLKSQKVTIQYKVGRFIIL